MKQYLNALLLVLSLHSALANVYAGAPSDSWKHDEMNPLPKAQSTNDKQINDISCGTGCKFDLHYFKGKNVPGGKNILFISGGPGQITKRVLKPGEHRFLHFLEDKYNVFYFDIRGAGFSAIDNPNKFDTALRAAHVVGDIERIRKAELGESVAWEAVYGHSHGTIVAQRYAKSSPSGSPLLNKLILSAPLSRRIPFEEARIDMLVNNLKSIFENYRQQSAGQQCPPGAPPPPLDPKGTDNFCFLTAGSDGMVDKLVSKFKQKLTDLSKEFGSVGFVTEYFDEILKEEKKRVTFPSKFPYPKDFYFALKRLSFFGGTEPLPLQAVDSVREARVNAAFLLGYYLKLDEEIDFKPGAEFNPDPVGCRPNAKFFEGVTHSTPADLWKEAFCDRYLVALAMLLEMEDAVADSKRANTVYALNDGIALFIFEILKVKPTGKGCIDSRRVKDFADGTDSTHKSERAVARRVGIDLKLPICLWNPEDFAHGIPTLILKGGADPIISGGQAEHVFQCGLTGERVLFEFPGAGHSMNLPEIDGKNPLAALVDIFLTKSVKEFSKDTNELRKQLHATMHTATGPGGTDICPPH